MSEFVKSGRVKSLEKADGDMEAINSLALEPLAPEDVYAFSVVACDNEIDRAMERFDDSALEEMAAKYVGKTVIKDHHRSADNQFARIFAASVEEPGGETSDGRALKQLVVKCYALDNEANSAMIADIRAGIKKEVSVSFSPMVVKCSICGRNNREKMCRHWPGKEYDGRECHFELSDIADCYELSFVAVPCQPGAGTKKDYAPEWEPEESGDEKTVEEEAAQAAFFMAKAIALADAEMTLRKE